MINKRSLWFLTLFSLILVLSVYYITMPSELLMTSDLKEKVDTVSTKEESESAELVALRVEAEEAMLDEISELKSVLTDSKTSTKEKNEAFNKMQNINKNRGKEEEIEQKIESDHQLKSFVKIDEKDIKVVIDSNKHDKVLANKIMRTVQDMFDEKMTISVKFQKWLK